MRDITAKKEVVTENSRDAIEKERDILKAVINGAKGVHLIYLDHDFNFVYVNEAYAKTCGHKPEEIIGKNHFKLYPHKENEAIFTWVRDTGKPVTYHDKPFVFPDQPERGVTYWDWTLEPVKDSSGKVEGLVFSLVENTERKKLEEQLTLSEDRYKAAVEGCNDGIWDRDLKTNKVFFSDQWKRILGYEPNEVVNQLDTFYKLIHPEDKEKMRAMVDAYIRGETPFYAIEFRMRHKDGSWRWILSRGNVLRDKKGVAYRIAGSHTDITERKKIEGELQRHTIELEALVAERTQKLKDAERLAAIGQTAGMVGHDIRNPLQSIIGDIYLAKTELNSLPDSEAKERLKESCEAIEQSVEYVNKIVMDLQDYARLLVPNAQQINLEDLIGELMLKKDSLKNIKATNQVANDAKMVIADSTLLKRILHNLIINAIQAMPTGGTLHINAYREANNVVITVKDTGAGIPEEAKSKLFTPLFTTKSKGQGFGLAVVKRLTEALDGTITFQSKEGQGTTFTIILPQVKNKQAQK